MKKKKKKKYILVLCCCIIKIRILFVSDYHEHDYPVFEDIEPSAIKLSWQKPARLTYDTEPITFALEKYRPVERKWESLATRLLEPSYRVTDLDRHGDNIFRMRTETEHGLSEPSLPISYSRRRGDFNIN